MRSTKYSTLNSSPDENSSGQDVTFVRILGFSNQANKLNFILDNNDKVKVRYDIGHVFVTVLEGEINHQGIYQAIPQKNWKEKFRDVFKNSTPELIAYKFNKTSVGEIFLKSVPENELFQKDTSVKFDFGKRSKTY